MSKIRARAISPCIINIKFSVEKSTYNSTRFFVLLEFCARRHGSILFSQSGVLFVERGPKKIDLLRVARTVTLTTVCMRRSYTPVFIGSMIPVVDEFLVAVMCHLLAHPVTTPTHNPTYAPHTDYTCIHTHPHTLEGLVTKQHHPQPYIRLLL